MSKVRQASNDVKAERNTNDLSLRADHAST
jgi:hypothetical protein